MHDAGDARVEGSPHVGAGRVGAMDALDPREQVALLKEELAKKEALIELAALKAQLQEKDSVLAAIEQSGGRPTSPTRRLSYVASPPLSPTGGGSSLAVVPAAGAADDELALPSVDEIVGAMRSPDEVQRGEAIDLLSELVNSAYGEDGRALAQAVRDAGGIALLAWMLTDPSLRVQQQTLLILGNLCSNSFDPASEETKALLMECAARTSPAQHSAQTPLTPCSPSPSGAAPSVPSSVASFPTTLRC